MQNRHFSKFTFFFETKILQQKTIFLKFFKNPQIRAALGCVNPGAYIATPPELEMRAEFRCNFFNDTHGITLKLAKSRF